MRELQLTTPRDAYACPARACSGRFWRRAATRRVAAFIVMSVFGLLCIQSAPAQIIPAKCQEMQPHAKRVLDAGRVAVEGVTSSNAYSETPGCDFYVMEIAVPASSTAPIGFRPSFGFQAGAADIDQILSHVTYGPPTDRCSSYEQEIWVRKKSVANNQMMGPGGFQHVAWWNTRGFWVGTTRCELRIFPSKHPGTFDPPKSGTDIYRVGVRVKTGVGGFLSNLHYWNVRIKVARRGQQIADPTGTQHSK